MTIKNHSKICLMVSAAIMVVALVLSLFGLGIHPPAQAVNADTDTPPKAQDRKAGRVYQVINRPLRYAQRLRRFRHAQGESLYSFVHV